MQRYAIHLRQTDGTFSFWSRVEAANEANAYVRARVMLECAGISQEFRLTFTGEFEWMTTEKKSSVMPEIPH